jgi:integrase
MLAHADPSAYDLPTDDHGDVMGWTLTRVGDDGKPRYTAVYRDLRGVKRSAGTFTSKRVANKAWQVAEVRLAEGRIGDPRRGRQLFQKYVEEEWLPNHVMEVTTREGYTYSLRKHILPWFGPMRMAEILPSHVREWITGLTTAGVSPATIRHLKATLGAIFTTALNDQVTFLHPCKGVKTPTVPVRPLQIVTAEQFDLLYRELPHDDARLLAETSIESGLRWGELTELRVKDLDFTTSLLTVSRAVVEVNPKYHPDGGRFLVKEYPKDKEYRRFKLSKQIVTKIKNHVKRHKLGPSDLIFAMRADVAGPPAHIAAETNPEALGHTEPNAAGHTYRHGTLSAYTAGKCRCEHCKRSFAVYRAGRRAKGRDNPRRPRTRDTDGHIPRDWFRVSIWKPALVAAQLGFNVRMKDLRHAHASWLLAGGADLQIVKERLGHASIATTEKYLHTLPDADETALNALARIRGRV